LKLSKVAKLAGPAFFGFLIIGLPTGCESTIDPQTGETTTRFNVPGTEANRENLERQWRECTRYKSRTVCRRRLGWSPARHADDISDDK
jgi:hypothetical protein